MPYTLLDLPLQINTPIPAHTQTHTVRVTHSSSYLPLVHTNPLTHSRACSQKGFHFESTFKAAQGPLSNITILLSLSLSKAHTITLLLQINSHFFRKGTRGARMPNEKFRNRQRNNSLFLPTASPSPCLCSSILTTTFHVYVSRLSIYLLSIFHCLVCFLSSRPFSRSLPMFVVRRECEAAESEQNFRTLQKFSSYFFFFSYNNTPTHPIAKWRLSV